MASSTYTIRIIPDLVNRKAYIVHCSQPLYTSQSLRKTKKVLLASFSSYKFFNTMYIFVNVSVRCCMSVILNLLSKSGGLTYISVLVGARGKERTKLINSMCQYIIYPCRSLVSSLFKTQLESNYYSNIFLILIYFLKHIVYIFNLYISNCINLLSWWTIPW